MPITFAVILSFETGIYALHFTNLGLDPHFLFHAGLILVNGKASALTHKIFQLNILHVQCINIVENASD